MKGIAAGTNPSHLQPQEWLCPTAVPQDMPHLQDGPRRRSALKETGSQDGLRRRLTAMGNFTGMQKSLRMSGGRYAVSLKLPCLT